MIEASPTRAGDVPAPPSGHPLAPFGVFFGAFVAIAWGLYLLRAPAPGGPGLDQSWRVGLTLATKEHLTFGRDVVFTFGPLGYVLQAIPDRTLAVSTLLWTLFLVAVAVAGVWTALRARATGLHKVMFIVAMFALGTIESLDYVAFVGVLALLVRVGRAPRAALPVGIVVGVVATFGLLSKYTLGIDVIAAGAAVWIVLALRKPRRRRLAVIRAALAAATIVIVGIGWTFRFAPATVGAYLSSAAEISSGYSSAMALPGPRIEIAAALLVGAAIIAVGILAARERKPELLALACVALFLPWKHGFVRQDGHVIAYFACAAVLAALLGLVVRRPSAVRFAGLTAAAALFMFAWSTYREIPNALALFEDLGRISRGAQWLSAPIETARAGEEATAVALRADAVPTADALRRSGSVDAMPVELSIILANRLPWTPLPVFQGYSAYTPALDELNRRALVDHGAAKIVYRYEAIDGRYPFSEMPATITEFACRYRSEAASVKTAGGMDYVQVRRAGACAAETPAGRSPARLGEPIAVPTPQAAGTFVRAYADLRLTPFGRLAVFLWRSPAVFLDVAWADNSTRRFRVVPATLGDGMIVSPIPHDQEETALFFAARDGVRVRSITISAPSAIYQLEGVSFANLRRIARQGATP